MKALISVALLFYGITAGATPYVRYESATREVVVVSIRNEDATPYFYFSPDVDEVPYVVRILTDKGERDISSIACGTGAEWHRLAPGSAIQIRIKDRAAFEAPGAFVIPLFFVSKEPEAALVRFPRITVAEARERAGRKKG